MGTNLPEIVHTAVDQAPQETWSVLAGVFAFASTLAASTFVQWRILGISTGSPRPLPTAGFVTVCAASLASHHVSIAAHEYFQNGKNPASYFELGGGGIRNNAFFSYREDYVVDSKYVKIPMHTVRM
jgi:hypothetical protein